MDQLFDLIGGILPGLVLWAIGAALGVLVFYHVVRAAVRRALRQHQEWLEERGLR
ncbi:MULTISPECIES: hypothetical protein [unclassified Salinibacterium]|uniref:hypothetical protein n=1 Tax=unclassified Salinibacterium TaxID=2632331 RepID=UPI001422986D|nr:MULTISPECIES: hypothetical protein [unclassified Salinibacterium]